MALTSRAGAGSESTVYRGPRYIEECVTLLFILLLSRAEVSDVADKTLWMGELPESWEVDEVVEAFKAVDIAVAHVKVVHMGADRGGSTFAFVEFDDASAAREAIIRLNKKKIPNSVPTTMFNLAYAQSVGSGLTLYSLHVEGLSPTTTEHELFTIFAERYSKCRNARVYHHLDGTPNGRGLISFSDETQQQQALVEMNKYRIHNTPILLKLDRFAKKVGGPKAKREEQWGANPAMMGIFGLTHGYGSFSMLSYPDLTNMSVSYPTCEQYEQPRPPSPMELWEPITAEDEQQQYLDYNDEVYEAMEASHWSPVIFDSSTSKQELAGALLNLGRNST